MPAKKRPASAAAAAATKEAAGPGKRAVKGAIEALLSKSPPAAKASAQPPKSPAKKTRKAEAMPAEAAPAKSPRKLAVEALASERPKPAQLKSPQPPPATSIEKPAAHAKTKATKGKSEAVKVARSPAARAAANFIATGDNSGGPPVPAAEPPNIRTLRCPPMSDKEVEALTVPFDQAAERLRTVLQSYGAAIVTDVASEGDRADLKRRFADDLAELVDLEAARAVGGAVGGAAERTAAKDWMAWPLASLSQLGPMERSQNRGLPHGRFAWAARLLPRVKQTYEILHGTSDLVCSCDNPFFAPEAHRASSSNKGFPHVDQNAHDTRWTDDSGTPQKDWEVYQGALYVLDSLSSHASTTVVWPGSHTHVYDTMMSDPKAKKRGERGEHFTQLGSLSPGPAATAIYEGWCKHSRRVPVPAGALFLWASRTVHQGWRGGPRLAQPVVWEPTCRRGDQARERKLRLAALGLPSTHWASLGFPHMLLGTPTQPQATEASSAEARDVRLPLRAGGLRPTPLVDGVGVDDMWALLEEGDWMEPLPPAVRKKLESSLRADIKAVL